MGDEPIARVFPKRVAKPRLNLIMPELEGLRDKKVLKKVNDDIDKKIRHMIHAHGFELDSQREVAGSYQLKLNTRGLVSLRLEMASWVSGSTSGISTVKGMTFDLRSGDAFKFRDLFNDDSDYLTMVNQWIQAEITQRNLTLNNEFISISKNQDFFLTATNLMIFFQINELTVPEWGVPEFAIPYDKLSAYAYKNGPVNRMLH